MDEHFSRNQLRVPVFVYITWIERSLVFSGSLPSNTLCVVKYVNDLSLGITEELMPQN